MRKILVSLSVAMFSLAANAQTIADFEALSLSKADTAYINYSAPLTDVGFNSGLAHFPCVYDTAYGGYWSSGFAYSNWTDSVTSGYTNQYSAKPASGFAGSAKYVVAYGSNNIVKLTGVALGQSVNGFYITNSTYAYNSMRDGDFVGKKFGGVSGHDSDWFKVDIFAYSGGSLKSDSVTFFLADFRAKDSSKNYIVREWQWVNLLPLGHADSLQFRLSSSDNGSFGMNTPAYFCMDNFITNETGLSIGNTAPATVNSIKIYPNPASNTLFVETNGNEVNSAIIIDYAGRVVAQYAITSNKLAINTSTLPSGTYILSLMNAIQNTTIRFVKQ
jgi:hypothetical protein